MIRCCVIGGAGFIGSYVSELLVKANRKVTALGRSAKPKYRLPEKAIYISGDYGDRKLLRSLLSNADEVVDLAYTTVPKTSFEDPIYDIGTNLPQSVGLLQEALHCNLRKVVIVSSGGTVYGNPRVLPISEDHPTNPISPYGITKLTIEKYAGMYVSGAGLPVVIVRPANAYGETQAAFAGQGFIATSIQSILDKKPVDVFGNPGTIRDYVHVKDIAKGIVAVLDQDAVGEVYNIGSGVGLNNIQVLECIRPLAQQDGYAIDLNILPYRQFDVPTNILDSSKLNKISGWAPAIAFNEGIRLVWNAARAKKPQS